MPVDIYVGGMEHAIMHLLYARFVHKFICDDLDIIDTDLREPFKELIVQGLVKGKTFKVKSSGKYITEEQIKDYPEDDVIIGFEKMSKSKGNGVSPGAVAKIFGVDALRAAMLFGAPPEKALDFDQDKI